MSQEQTNVTNEATRPADEGEAGRERMTAEQARARLGELRDDASVIGDPHLRGVLVGLLDLIGGAFDN